MDKLTIKKQQKRTALLNAAYHLFLKKGFGKTTIDDIVKNAGVGKGTFYLYFEDKDALIKTLIFEASMTILEKASNYTNEHQTNVFEDNVIIFANYIIDYFTEHEDLLRICQNNFSWPVIKEKIHRPEDAPVLFHLIEDFKNSPNMQKYTEVEMYRIIYIIVEMCGSICYDCIIKKEPSSIDHFKPTLFLMIRKMLS